MQIDVLWDPANSIYTMCVHACVHAWVWCLCVCAFVCVYIHCVFVCICLCVCVWENYFKAAPGTVGFISFLCVITMPAFFPPNGPASDIVHNPVSATLKCPLSQNRSGPLYLTDAQESFSHHGNTSRPATATDSPISKDGCCLSRQHVHLVVFLFDD